MKNKGQITQEAIKEVVESLASGQNFSSKAPIRSLDLVDSQKKEYCEKIGTLLDANGGDEEALKIATKALNLIELRAAIHHRTERLALERLIELYSNAAEKRDVMEVARKALIIKITSNPNFRNLKLNEQTKRLLMSGSSDLLHFDFLVGLMEKLGIDHNSLAIGV